ncbi:integrase core domain-containing protein [Candidatus Palauibacter sp.]|uniref:integrase core domain-containing protein n=1 Tax=Candidatus Palauibacter sp. TaxID=3101350 RepID=UPI003B02AFDF
MSRIWASANSGLAPSAWTAAERTTARLRHSLDGVIVHQDRDPVEALAAVVRDRINYYNRVRRHSSLGDRPPMTIVEDFYRED